MNEKHAEKLDNAVKSSDTSDSLRLAIVGLRTIKRLTKVKMPEAFQLADNILSDIAINLPD